MKYYLNQITVAIASLCLSMLIPHAAEAYTFGQKEVDQSKLIAIAAPFADGKLYNLIVLEQISPTQSCWQEKSDQPGVIDPLLLKFDFTGVCGRSTDSNGYSIRQAGQDLALNYRLSIIKRKDRLVLMGYPVRNPSAPPLTIGQTQSRAPGFLKIDLAPGWRFTKRTYNHKTLGHIYFTQNHSAAPIASTPVHAKSQTPTAPRSKALTEQASVPQQLTQHTPTHKYPYPAQRLQPPPGSPQSNQPPSEPNLSIEQQNRDALTTLITSPIEIPVPESKSSAPTRPLPKSPSKPSSPGAVTQPSADDDAELPVLSSDEELVPLPPASTPQPPSPSQGRNYHSSPSASSQTESPMTLAASPPLSPASAPINIPVPAPTRASSPRSAPATPAPDLETIQDGSPIQEDGKLPVPEGEVPLGSFDPDPDIYTASQDSGRADALAAPSVDEPPPPPLDERSRLRYRVVVQASDLNQQTKIKTLVPDAFRSSYRGRSVFQVGAYESQAEADERLELLNQAGMTGIIETR